MAIRKHTVAGLVVVLLAGAAAAGAQPANIGGTGAYVTGYKATIPLPASTANASLAVGTAFDPTGSHLYFVVDNTDAATQGLYAMTFSNNYTAGVVSPRLGLGNAEHPSDVAVDASGDVYVVYDYTAAVRKVSDPMGSPMDSEVFSGSGFLGGTGDDDPFAISIAPAGFTGTNVNPGDLLLLDKGLDGNANEALLAVAPDGSASATLAAWPNPPAVSYDGDLLLMDVDTVRDRVYLVPQDMTGAAGNTIFIVGADGAMTPQPITVPDGALLSNLQVVAVNPIDGSLWIGDDDTWPSDVYEPDDAIYRIDPETFVATLEIDFDAEPGNTGRGQGFPDFNYFMTFTPDGANLVVSDRDDDSPTADSLMVFGIVPEPATALLMLAGLGLVARRRRP